MDVFYCLKCNHRHFFPNTKTGHTHSEFAGNIENDIRETHKCLICYKEYMNKSSLKRHMKKKHLN